MSTKSKRRLRFGLFEVDLTLGELRRSGRLVRLQEQPLLVLKGLLERPGAIVTREELRREVWGDGVYVDFDRSLNTAIARLREALGDSPHRPVYIETVPRKGYRFICPVEPAGEANGTGAADAAAAAAGRGSRHRKVGLGVAAVAAVLLAWWIGWRTQPPVEPASALSVEPLTRHRGLENEATFSPDGSQFAFTWNGEGQDNFDIYIRTLEGQQTRRLTMNPAREMSPAWSPDGQWIAYGRDLGDGRAEIVRRSPLGGREERLLEIDWEHHWAGSLVAYSRLLAWTPDSRSLVLSHRDDDQNHASLWLFDVDSGEMRSLTAPPAPYHDSDPAVSPDGRRLAFTRRQNNILIGYVLSLSAGPEALDKPIQVTPRGAFVGPAWTPIGDRLIFSGPIQQPGLWIADPSGAADPKPIFVEAGARSVMPAVRPDGKLAVTSATAEMNIWRFELRSDGTPPQSRELIASTASDMLPHYSPDGRSITFLSSRRKGNFIADADGANVAHLSEFGIARWSPDGSRLVCDGTSSAGNRHGDLWIVEPDGGPRRQLTSGDENDRMPSWSRDGKWIYFASDRSGGEQIWKMPADGPETDAVQLTNGGGFSALEAFDGETLYYTKSDERGLWMLRDGIESRLIDASIGFADYAVTPTGIYYGRKDIGSGDAIYRYRFSDGTTEEVFRPAKRLGIGLDVSPDGRYLVYTQFDREESDLLLLEGLR